ncbi:MAG TPA: hypothetical protein VLZ84_02480 [Asticcacaulis sp.]|nr:hypothetical protein [Asticcacaulis sp.]
MANKTPPFEYAPTEVSKRMTLIIGAVVHGIFALIAASILAWVALLVYSKYVAVQNDYEKWSKSAYAHQGLAAQEIALRCSQTAKGAVSLKTCLNAEIRAYQENENTDQDLKAQRDMAWWAMWGFYLSLSSTIIGAVGLIFLWKSLNQTRIAISNDREVGDAQVRAYLSVSPIMIADGGFGTDFKIMNSGQSPAKNVKYVAAIFCDSNPTESYSGDIIAPSGVETITGNVIPPDDHIEGKAGTADGKQLEFSASAHTTGKPPFVRFVCHVFYKDVFNKDRITKYSAVLIAIPAPRNLPADFPKDRKWYSWNITNTHNDFT